MARHILLLRAVNVGGVKLAMADLRSALAALGFGNVKTHIQSGNAVFDDPAGRDITTLRAAITQELHSRLGLATPLFIFTPQAFAAIAKACPYADEGAKDGAKVHVFFLAGPTTPNLAALQSLTTTERFHFTAEALYLHAPDGIGRSKLALSLPRHLKTAPTARNWNTVQALLALAAA